MILPEHKEAINQRKETAIITTEQLRPVLGELELEELASRLAEAMEEETVVRLDVWGRDDALTGRIVKLDSRTKLVHVERSGDTLKVPFLDITEVGSPD